MGLIKPVTRAVISEGTELENALKSHMNQISSRSYFPKKQVEEILLRQMEFEVWRLAYDNKFTVPEGFVKFTPSSASKCKREMFYKALKMKQDEVQQMPFNNRWTRNSSAIHGAVQRDLLYGKFLLDNPLFTVNMVNKKIGKQSFGSLPAWERNIEDFKIIEHKGVKFVLSGMMDGILTYEKDGRTVGFEYKTKSNDAWQVHKANKPSPAHIQQCVAYSLLFDGPDGKPINDYLITYEAVAKDKWDAGASALQDVKVFHITVTDRQKKSLLDKFSEVAGMVENAEIPAQQTSKCLFCPYKNICLRGK